MTHDHCLRKERKKLNFKIIEVYILLNTTLKIVTKIIQNKLIRILKLEDEQQGFRSGRSCVDAVFIMRQITEKAIEYNKPVFICFIDLEKAFD